MLRCLLSFQGWVIFCWSHDGLSFYSFAALFQLEISRHSKEKKRLPVWRTTPHYYRGASSVCRPRCGVRALAKSSANSLSICFGRVRHRGHFGRTFSHVSGKDITLELITSVFGTAPESVSFPEALALSSLLPDASSALNGNQQQPHLTHCGLWAPCLNSSWIS